nr:E3 ubiquitin-protein ligase SINA-like 7 [Solanum lycopersicum]
MQETEDYRRKFLSRRRNPSTRRSRRKRKGKGCSGKLEEEAEEEDWGSESEGNFRSSGDRRVPVRESEVLRENKSISGESVYQNFEDSIINRSISVTLLDPDVLDCLICFEHLCVPVFQGVKVTVFVNPTVGFGRIEFTQTLTVPGGGGNVDLLKSLVGRIADSGMTVLIPSHVCGNGHIACAPFCIKIANKCPSCCLPIGYNRCQAMENVLESLKVSGVNNRNGCKEILNLSTSAKVYAHFSEKHASSAEHISFNAVHPIYIEKDQRYIILQMRTDVILFIINHASDCVGSVINIIRVGPFKQKRRFSYELVVTDGESSFKLESVEESVPNWSEDSPLKKFLVVPKVVVNSSARLKLNVLIENKE